MSVTQYKFSNIAELQNAIREEKTTVRALTESCLEVIKEGNDNLNAITVVNKDALQEADRLDSLPSNERGPLHGLPILIKDQIDTEGIATAYGSIACKNHIPTKDATLVRKLKEAGALILGKTTMPDWAASWFSTSSLSGETKHPIDPSRDPGGSSSGSAAAVAAGLAPAAIGGDTGGSIRLPCSFCGLVGVRVTPGRISRDGMSALVTSQDTPGPMCRTVEDVARILDVIVGFDENDPYTSINVQAGRSASTTRFQDAIRGASLQGKRLGVLRQAFGAHNGIQSVLDPTLADLKEAGADLIDVDIPELEHFKTATSLYVIRSKYDINEFLQSREALEHLSVESLYSEETYHKCLDLFRALAKGPTDPCQSPHFGRALSEISRFQGVVGSIFARNDLDAMVYPTSQVLAPKTQDLLDKRWDSAFPTNTVIGSQLLWTAVSVPIGRVKDDEHPDDPELPVGLEILGVPMSEKRILNIAAGIEARVQRR